MESTIMRKKFKNKDIHNQSVFLNLYILFKFIFYILAEGLTVKGLQRIYVDKFLPIS